VEPFWSPEEEITCPHKIVIPIDDNTKYSIKDYREAIYADIIKKKKEQRQKLKEKYFAQLGITSNKPEPTQQNERHSYVPQGRGSVNSSFVQNQNQNPAVNSSYYYSRPSTSALNSSYNGDLEEKPQALQERKSNHQARSGSFYASAAYQKTQSSGTTSGSNALNSSFQKESTKSNYSTVSYQSNPRPSSKGGAGTGSSIASGYANYYQQTYQPGGSRSRSQSGVNTSGVAKSVVSQGNSFIAKKR